MRLKRNIILFSTLIFIYVFLLDYNYATQIAPIYGYMGLNYYGNNVASFFIGTSFTLVHLFWLLRFNKKRPTSYFFWLFFIFLIIPINYINFLSQKSMSFDSFLYLLFFNISFFSIFCSAFLMRNFNILKLKKLDLFKYIVPLITVSIVLLLFASNGFRLDLNFADIYIRRLDAREVLMSGSLFGYLEAFLSAVFLPFLFIYSYFKRRYDLLLLVVFGMLVVFSIKGSKGVMFAPVYLILVSFASRKKFNFGIAILFFIVLLNVLAILENEFLDTSVIANLIIRRKFLVPAQLSFYYHEFFSLNGLVYMKDSIFGQILGLDSGFPLQRSRLIGEHYFDKVEYNANANIIATGYADFGLIGMILTGLISGFYIGLIELYGRNSKFLTISIMAYIAIVWSEGALYTSFITNGLLLLLIIIAFQKWK